MLLFVPDMGNIPQALHIESPEWLSPGSALTVPAVFVGRLEEIRAGMEEGGNMPDPRFIAAAVLSDQMGERPDSSVASHARLLAAADEVIREEPAARVLVAGGYYLHAAIAAPNTGLAFMNGNGGRGMLRPMGVVMCDAVVEMDVMNEEEPRVAVAREEAGRTITTFLTPDFILTPANIAAAGEITDKFPDNQVLAAGGEAIGQFFSRARSPEGDSPQAVARRRLATVIAEGIEEKIEVLQSQGARRSVPAAD
jgi:hypothetical protein